MPLLNHLCIPPHNPLVTLEPVDYPTFLGDLIPVLWSHHEVSDGIASFKMYLDSNLATYNLEAFTKPPGAGPHIDAVVAVAVDVVSLVYSMVVMGLITTMSIIVVGLKSV